MRGGRSRGSKRAVAKKGPKPVPSPPRTEKLASEKPPRPRPAVAEPLRAPPRAARLLPVVGVGASAGGLEALEVFLRHVHLPCGLAFVVIQHLDPYHKGMLVELLQRATRMPVAQAADGVRVEPDHVYVIPPGKDISLLHGTLHLLPQTSPRGLNLPIDFFFRSLAEDQHERGIGVLLSGMGSDGTLGLRAIKEKAGAAFVQSPASAKFTGMPQSAIDAGLADVVVPVEEMPAKIAAYCAHAPAIGRSALPAEENARGALDKVFVLLRAHTGNDFSQYKHSTILRRVERRMGLHQIEGLPHYVRYLRDNPREIDLLFKELLIGVTNFFRDSWAWDHLKLEAVPTLLSAPHAGGVLRAWVPGCSTGEEAYSLAIVLKEAMASESGPPNLRLQIFATDLDADAIDAARLGIYPANIAADVSPERLRQFFVEQGGGYRIAKEIRESVVFAQQNVVMDPPFTKLDLVSCRNLLIYLSADIQKRLIPLFHYSLNPGGILFLGNAETIGTFTTLFAPLDGKTRLYRRLDQPAALPVEMWSPTVLQLDQAVSEPSREDLVPTKPASPNLQSLADRVLVQRFAPVGVLCNEKGDVLYISGRAGKYLEPAVGKVNVNVFAMARDGLRSELSRAFATALREGRPIAVRGVKVGTNGGTQIVDITVQRLADPVELRGTVMVVFTDVAAPPATAKPSAQRKSPNTPRMASLETELQQSREEVQAMREEMQTSQEELKSTNEELQSTNEELQSSNEELTTSKEEMQSLNEELQTVNHELQAKVDELSRTNNDMKNLLNSTEIATLFLDGDLNVRRFTTPTARIIKLIAGDAGRPITDITSDLDYPDLAADAREVLRTLVFKERLIPARDGRWFTVRIMPYRTLENVIDGLVITFSDASASRALESMLREQASHLRQMAEALPNLVWGAGPDGAANFFSKRWVEYTGIPENEQLGRRWLEQIHPEDRERVTAEWDAAIKSGASLDAELRLRNAAGGYRWFRAHAVAIRDPAGRILMWHGATIDVNDQKRAESVRETTLHRLADVIDYMREGFLEVDRDMVIRAFNPAAERILGRKREQVERQNLFDAIPEIRGSVLERKLADSRQADGAVSFEAELPLANGGGPIRVRARREATGKNFAMFLATDAS